MTTTKAKKGAAGPAPPAPAPAPVAPVAPVAPEPEPAQQQPPAKRRKQTATREGDAAPTPQPAKRIKSVAAPPAPEPVAVPLEPVATLCPVEDAPDTPAPKRDARQRASELLDAIAAAVAGETKRIQDTGLLKEYKATLSVLKSVERRTRALVPLCDKLARGGKRRRSTPASSDGTAEDRTPSGFKRPVGLSEALVEFTGWEKERHLKSRIDVTRHICKYVKDNNLQNPTDRRHIIADDRLAKLLSIDRSQPYDLSFYTLQRMLKPHFFTMPETTA